MSPIIGSLEMVSTINDRNSSESPTSRALARKAGVSMIAFMPINYGKSVVVSREK
jgi:hypothetical protein